MFAYPVGVTITATIAAAKLELRFGLRNNAARPLERVELQVLAPAHLDPETEVPTSTDEDRWLRCLPQIVPCLDIDEAVEDVCRVMVSPSDRADDAFILGVTTAPYRWTGSAQLDTFTTTAKKD